MIARSPFPCVCPVCGTGHYDCADPRHGRIEPIRVPVRRIGTTLLKDLAYIEAIARSRLLMVGPVPTPIIRRLDIAASDPKRAHLSRCPMRRPRLSLLERVRAELSRRRA